MCRVVFFAVIGSVLGGASGLAQGDIVLSQYMGAPSGSATSSSNAPYTVVNTPAGFGGFGIDTAGSFSSGAQIDFVDSGPYQYGIGAHPQSSISFMLDAFRDIEAGIGTFAAVIGIDTASGGFGGARFEVFVDGVEVFAHDVSDDNAGGTAVSIDFADDAQTLTLNTFYITVGSNHAAWADARLVVPAPAAAAPLMIAVFASRRRR